LVFSAVGAIACALVLFGFCAAFKGLKVAELSGHYPTVGVVWMFLADASLAMASAAVGIAMFRLMVPFTRFAAIAVHALVLLWSAVVLELTVIEHESWVATGTLIDWTILKYTLAHMHELSQGVGAEMHAATIAALVGAPLAAALPLAAEIAVSRIAATTARGVGGLQLAVRPARHETAIRGARVSKRTWRLAGGAAVVAAAAAGLSMVPGPVGLQSLNRSGPGSILAGAIVDLVDGSGDDVEEGVVPEGTAGGVAEDQSWWQARLLQRAEAVQWKSEDQKPQNVVVVIIESGRWDASTILNPDVATTPNMAAMALHGAVVERVYTDVPHTSKAIVGPLCGYSPRHTFEIQEAQPQGLPMPCLAHYLRGLGYETAFFQSATMAFENRPQLAENLGFQEFYGFESLDCTGFEKTNWLGMEDDVMLQPGLDWIDRTGSKPFFITFLTIISHHEYGLPDSWQQKRLAPRGSDATYDRYLNAVSYIDAFIGKIRKGLEERGLADHTLLVVFGDHGQGFKEHGRIFHNDVIYDEGLRVPLLFSNPELFPSPVRIRGLRRLADVTPSILSIIGADSPEEAFDGEDVFSTPGHKRVYSSCWYKERCQAEVDGWLKVIHHFDREPPEVFDLETDPHEEHNLLLAGGERQSAAEGAVDAAVERMNAWREDVSSRYRGAWEELGDNFLLDEAPVPEKLVRARFGEALELIGFDVSAESAVPGAGVDLTAYFRCLGGVDEGWKILTHLETVDHRVKAFDHDPAMGRMKLEDCEADSFVADRVRVWIPPDFPNGTLKLYWGVFRKGERAKITALSPNLIADDERLALLDLDVAGPHPRALEEVLDESVDTEPLPVDVRLDIQLGDSLVLTGVTIEPKNVRRGKSVTVTTVYEVLKEVDGNWKPFLHVYPQGGKLVRRDHPPVSGLHPVASWKAGTFVRDRYKLSVPRGWPAGEVTMWGGLFSGRKRFPVSDPGNAEVDEDGRILIGKFRVLR